MGIAGGVILGILVANQVSHSDRARIAGAVAGATVGGLIGQDMDRRRCELARIAQQYDLQLKTSTVLSNGAVVPDTNRKDAAGMVVEVHEPAGRPGHFDSNSDQLTQAAQSYFSAIADAYHQRASSSGGVQRKILLIGHTDDTGDTRLNADLSERRARTVAAYMEKRGIPPASLYYQGAGEAYPIADNSSEPGRAQNRRVEIVEVADSATFNRYLADRKPRYDLYRTTEASAVARLDVAPPQTKAAPARPSAPANTTPPASDGIDFGGTPFSGTAAIDIGKPAEASRLFSLISAAHADAPAIITDCSRDRPRIANSVKTLADGKTYRTSEYLPGLYGKTWADLVNGHLVVLNKVSVLASEGAAANLPEFKVYPNYKPANSAIAAINATPDVNTYLGDKGVLYRMFLKDKGGLLCADVVFGKDGGNSAHGGRLIYSRGARLMSADFKPSINRRGSP
nr:OmpA family protein [Duganella guangzhouensis]